MPWLMAMDSTAYHEGEMWMHAGSLMVAVGLVGVGIAVWRSKAKDKPETPAMHNTRQVTGAVLIFAGIALPIYLWFSGIG